MCNLALRGNQELAKKNEIETYILAATAAHKNEAITRGPIKKVRSLCFEA